MSELWKALAALLKGARPWQTVLPWEKGLRVRLGKWVTEQGPGPHLKIPFIDEYILMNTRLRISSTQLYTIQAMTGEPMSVSMKVAYRITDPLAIFKRYHHADSTVNLMVVRAMTRYIAYTDYDELDEVDMEEFVTSNLANEPIELVWVAVTDLVHARAYRLLQGDRPHTRHDQQMDALGKEY